VKKLLSRKLWVALSSAAVIVVAAFSKELSWAEAAPSLAAIVIGYCASQGWIDAKEIEHAIAEQTDEAPAPPVDAEEKPSDEVSEE